MNFDVDITSPVVVPEVQETDVQVARRIYLDLQKEQREKLELLDKQRRLIRDLQDQINQARDTEMGITIMVKELKEKEINQQELVKRLEREEEEHFKLEGEAKFLADLMEQILQITEGFEGFGAARDYQKEDILHTIAAYVRNKTGVLNANDMGLGKTYEAIICIYILSALFQREHGRRPKTLWLTKKSLMVSSPKEIRHWWNNVKIYAPVSATDAKSRTMSLEIFDMAGGEIFVANYEFIRTTPLASEIVWDFVVIDEVHKLKGGANPNGPTAIWTAIKEVCNKSRFNLMLSGTPMVNRPEEMWAYLHIFSPERFPDLKKFQKDFMEYKDIAVDYKLELKASSLLKNVLKGQMIRRGRYDPEVQLQLPDLTPIERMLDMNPQQAEIYEQMRKNFFVWLDSQDTPLTATAIIAQLIRLRQINVWPDNMKFKETRTMPNGDTFEVERRLECKDSSKIDEAMEIIEEAHDQVVVFSTFNEPLSEIKKRCESLKLTCEVINGSTVSHMGEYERKFQEGSLDVLCINSAMGEGLNLQKNPDRWPGGSSIAIFLDLWWSPARNEQCEARIHRSGAVNPCTVYYLKNNHSIDQFMDALLEEKKASFDTIMDSDVIRPSSDWRNFLEGTI